MTSGHAAVLHLCTRRSDARIVAPAVHFSLSVNATAARLPGPGPSKEKHMLKWALIFAVIALVAGLFGFTGIAAGAAGIAKILLVVFLVLFVAVLLFALLGAKAVADR